VADDIDQANDLSERLRTEALAEQRQHARQRALRTSSAICADCGETIPPARRRALAGVRRCISCAAQAERKERGR
jgi:phage/conjugal plasmid C-4 type zinc finger TraR family protein